MQFQELDGDQRREKVNSDQRYVALHDARKRAASFRGSLVWQQSKGEEYLARSYYDTSGNRRQKSEGRRSSETERMKADWEKRRSEARDRLKTINEVMQRQSAINRALRLGRVPLLGARIIRAIDDAGLLGSGLRIVGTNAIYAYEAAAGVFVDPGITATLDIDLLMDARQSLRMTADSEISDRTLISLLRKADRSFERSQQTFRATNKEGYLVDLIRPQRSPPWHNERSQLGEAADELMAAAVDGLAWLESAPGFEAVAIDERGAPFRMVAVDPRVFAAHKLWLSSRSDREPAKRRRDAAQAKATAQLVTQYLTYLPYDASELRMLPKPVFEAAIPLFEMPSREE